MPLMPRGVRRLFGRDTPIVPVVRLAGVIGQRGALRYGLSLASLAGLLHRAFAVPRARAVALAINSPGGSAAQSALIARRIRELADEKKRPVFAFVEDVAASGGYWLATAADEIYADATSFVGSIGVVAAGFGFQDLIARHGIERRVHTAGTRKVILDPFQAERPEDVAKLLELQRDIHQAFIAHVKARRGDRLNGDDATVFDGEFWTGHQALRYGLIDGLGHMRTVLRDKFGDKVRMMLIADRRSWLARRLSLSAPALTLPEPPGLAASVAAHLLDAVEERLHWQRFGL